MAFLFFFRRPCLFCHHQPHGLPVHEPLCTGARRPLIGGLVFFGLVAFLIFIVLTWFGFMMADPDRERMELLNGVTDLLRLRHYF